MKREYHLNLGVLTLALEVHCPNQTHLNMLIKLFRITTLLLAGESDQGRSKTLQECGSRGPDSSKDSQFPSERYITPTLNCITIHLISHPI